MNSEIKESILSLFKKLGPLTVELVADELTKLGHFETRDAVFKILVQLVKEERLELKHSPFLEFQIR